MRIMMKVTVPVETGNSAIKNGTLPQIVEKFVEKYRPEAAYFAAENGERTAFFVFEMTDSKDLPAIAEPFFMGFNARVQATPCMNLEDMKAGVAKAAKAR